MALSVRAGRKFALVAVALVFYYTKVLLTNALSGKNIRRGFKIRRAFCRRTMKILGIEVDYQAPAIPGNCLFISNHRSLLDPLIQLGFIDTFILSKAEVGSYPVMGAGAKATGVIFVERTSDASRKAALESIEKLLLEGMSVMIYPEGTTTAAQLTSDFRRGGFEVAYKLNVPVVPVMIDYPDASYYWTEGSLLDYFNRIFSQKKKHHVRLHLSTPIDADTAEQLLAKVKSQIDAMILRQS